MSSPIPSTTSAASEFPPFDNTAGICRGVIPVCCLQYQPTYLSTPINLWKFDSTEFHDTYVCREKKIMMRSSAMDNCFYPFVDLKASDFPSEAFSVLVVWSLLLLVLECSTLQNN
jgi:hypothetical protein